MRAMPGHTLSEIRTLLAAAGLSPQYRFGQNFLIDLNLMRKLVDAAGLNSDDVVLEVGPGTGSLTELLLASGARVVAA
ncbi:MAG TPA: rRNA adenine N-6-methyltransferase family protein, partial [Phycisphaerae bacterium]|nr:rRNA adenine N-6-methyltransferase family protein [Phycisphaerae bacterium]